MISIPCLKLKINLHDFIFSCLKVFKHSCSLIFWCSLMSRGDRKLGPRSTCFIVSLFLFLLSAFSSRLANRRLIFWHFCLILLKLNVYTFSLSSIRMIGKSRASFFEFVCSFKTRIHSGYSRNPFPILLCLGLLKTKVWTGRGCFLSRKYSQCEIWRTVGLIAVSL